jgi:ketosteroid isomerase-like protein
MTTPSPLARRIAPAHRAAALALSLLAVACAALDSREDPQDAMFAAERAFAQRSVADGMRAAFASNFADDGVVFWPAPIRLHDALAKQAAPANPKASTLDWAPAAGGVARSGDLGFTTGPWTRTDNVGNAPARHGLFFSVWRRQGERWLVVADAGAQAQAPVPASLLAPAPRVGPQGAADPAPLLASERAVATRQAYGGRFASDAMFASDAAGVIRGAAVAARWRGDLGSLRLEPAFADVASSGDLGYSYGSFAAGTGNGYYLHLWTRDAAGAWRIAVAIHQAAESP